LAETIVTARIESDTIWCEWICVRAHLIRYFPNRMPAKDGDTVTLRIGTSRTLLTVEAAVSDAARIQGLSDRRSMPKAHGMIFIFDGMAIRGMWMNRMRFPLDIVWLDDYLRVVSITRGCQPCKTTSACPTYTSVVPARYAIELNAGDADGLGFREGVALRVI
jgi:uncharacterized membrane protein (UPF0127 family)